MVNNRLRFDGVFSLGEFFVCFLEAEPLLKSFHEMFQRSEEKHVQRLDFAYAEESSNKIVSVFLLDP